MALSNTVLLKKAGSHVAPQYRSSAARTADTAVSGESLTACVRARDTHSQGGER